jgi:hypothetical protein
VAMPRGQLGDLRKVTSAIGNRYLRTGEGQQKKRTQCVCSEL